MVDDLDVMFANGERVGYSKCLMDLSKLIDSIDDEVAKEILKDKVFKLLYENRIR